jgi:hypothetical protein
MPASKPVSSRRVTAASSNSGEDFADLSHIISQLMQEAPDTITSLIEMLLHASDGHEAPQGKGKGLSKKTKRKEMGGGALGRLLSQALEEVRYDVERNRKDAIAYLADLRQYLLDAGKRPDIDPDAFFFVLQQFAAAKVDIGDGLRDLGEQILEERAVISSADEAPSFLEVAKELKGIAKALNDDPFAIHRELFEFAQTLPADARAMLAATVLEQTDTPALRDAALGWLLDDAAEVRRIVAQALEKLAASNSGTMLRRMIAMRNWVPEADRPALDRAIKASQKKVACAGWPSAKVLEVYASGFDGSGAQSVFVIAAQGRKRTFAALLFKQDMGVRDAWANRDATQAEVNATLEAMAMQMDLSRVPLEYAANAIRHFLGVNAQTGIMPPFGLLEVAEVAGLTDVNPKFQPVDALLSSLCAGIAPERTTPRATADALKTSASWGKYQPVSWSWFEESDEADAILARGGLSKAKRKAALLAMPLQKRRRWWATLFAWTAYTMKHVQGASGWEDYVLVARELLGERPLDEFGIMNKIADATVANYFRWGR